MNTHEKFEACMRLAEFSATRHDGRRDYEWKVTLGLWAALVAGIAKFRGETLPTLLGPLSVLSYAFIWLRGIWVANETDKQLSRHYRSQAEKVLVAPTHSIAARKVRIPWYCWSFGFLFDWSMLFQLIATVALVLLAYLFIR
jgi:hypothetical protein